MTSSASHSPTPLVLASQLALRVPMRAGGMPRTHDSLSILDGIDLRVEHGEVAAIVGPSGSGKTSLLMLLAGLERPTSGRIVVAGHDLAALDESGLAAFRREAVGIVFQSFHLIPGMTALENVLIPLELADIANGVARATAALEAVGLGGRLHHRPAELSGGEQQRVALARAVVGEPALLLADEPTGNLDPATGETIISLLFDLRARLGTTLILVTHDHALAARCDRVIALQNGRIVPTVGMPSA